MSIISGIGTVASLLSLLKSKKDNPKETYNDIKKMLPKDLAIADSYISFTKPFVVNPITMVDQTLEFDEDLSVILSTANLVFASYYTLALQADSTLGGVNVRQKLDKFNPERKLSVPSMEGMMISNEAFYAGLPSLENGVQYSEEAVIDPLLNTGRDATDPKSQLKEEVDLLELKKKQAELTSNKTEIKDITPKENKNLFLGRTFSVTLQEGVETINISVVIRLMTEVIDKESMVHMLSLGKYAYKAIDRFKRWRTGTISFADLFLCRDILDAHRRALKHDQSGIYRDITKRGLNNAVAALTSKQASVGTNSGIAVISEDTARDIEFRIGDKLDKASVRDRVFQSLNLMLLFVYDPAYGHVTMYQRGLNYSSESTIKEMKGGTDKADKGADISELFKRIASGDKLF